MSYYLSNGIEDDETKEEGKGNWFEILSEDQKTEIKNVFKNSLKEKDFQKTLNKINRYKENTPQKLQKFVNDGIWIKRVAEISVLILILVPLICLTALSICLPKP